MSLACGPADLFRKYKYWVCDRCYKTHTLPANCHTLPYSGRGMPGGTEESPAGMASEHREGAQNIVVVQESFRKNIFPKTEKCDRNFTIIGFCDQNSEAAVVHSAASLMCG